MSLEGEDNELDNDTFGDIGTGGDLPSFFSNDTSEAEVGALLAHMRDSDMIVDGEDTEGGGASLPSFFTSNAAILHGDNTMRKKESIFGSESQEATWNLGARESEMVQAAFLEQQLKSGLSQVESVYLSQAGSDAGYALPSFMLDDERLDSTYDMLGEDDDLIGITSKFESASIGSNPMTHSVPTASTNAWFGKEPRNINPPTSATNEGHHHHHPPAALYLAPNHPLSNHSLLSSSHAEKPKQPEKKLSLSISTSPIPARWTGTYRMTAQDVFYIIRTILRNFAGNGDPYIEDFYFYQVGAKKANGGEDINISMPAPREREVEDFETRKHRVLARAVEFRTKIWESTNSVLGHTQRSDVKKPRQLLNLSDPADEDEGVDASESTRFTSQRWHIRRSIEDGVDAILDISDVARRASFGGLDTEERNSLVSTHASAVKRLGSALGIDALAGGDGNHFTIKESVLLRIVHVFKGKKLFLRALPLLAPPQRDVLLPVVIKHLLRFVCSVEYSLDGEKIDDKVSKVLVETFNANPIVPLGVLSECVEAMVDAHTLDTLPVVLQHTQSASVIEALLTNGEAGASEERWGSDDWNASFDKLKQLVNASNSM